MDNILVQKRIFDLYGEKEYTVEEVKSILEKYKEKAEVWEIGLKDYTTEDILRAIDEYWRYKNSEKKPRLAHIQAMLRVKKDDFYVSTSEDEEREKLARLAEITKEQLIKQRIEKYGC